MYKVYASWMKENECIIFRLYSQMMTWFDTIKKNNPTCTFTYAISGNTMFISMEKR